MSDTDLWVTAFTGKGPPMSTDHSVTAVGINLSKNWLDAHSLRDGKSWDVSTNPDSLAESVRQLPDGIDLAVMEGSGGKKTSLLSCSQRRIPPSQSMLK